MTIDDIQHVTRFKGIGEPTEEAVLSVLFDYDYEAVILWFGKAHQQKLSRIVLGLIKDQVGSFKGSRFVLTGSKGGNE